MVFSLTSNRILLLAKDPGVTTMASELDSIKVALQGIAQSQAQLVSTVESMSKRLDGLEHAGTPARTKAGEIGLSSTPPVISSGPEHPAHASPLIPADAGTQSPAPSASSESKSGFTSRIILTTYPSQIGINPLPMEWGAADPLQRGPITVSRAPSTIRRRNAIGAHGGSYSIYYALALASRELNPDHKPDFTNTEPAANIGPFPQWADKKKIVSMDPWGHLVPWTFKDIIQKENGRFINLFPLVKVN